MDKYIGFDINSKKIVTCVVQKGKTCKGRNEIAAGVGNTRYSPKSSRTRAPTLYEATGTTKAT
jgi:hypothetical protein